MHIPVGRVRDIFGALQERITSALESVEGTPFERDAWTHACGSGGLVRYCEGGVVFERARILFDHMRGAAPPAAATCRPELSGCNWETVVVSIVLHPRNPHVPASHMNVRLLVAHEAPGAGDLFWFGGGLDLTPCYPVDEDIRHFHRVCHDAVTPFGQDKYPRFKRWCDEYFYLHHRDETRGTGGLFYDDLSDPDFESCFALTGAIGNCFLEAYVPIVLARKATPYGDVERAFQAYRRGRYVEFDLIYDRGSLFGLRSEGRADAILLSLPPEAQWRYQWQAAPGSPEAALADYLKPRSWIS